MFRDEFWCLTDEIIMKKIFKRSNVGVYRRSRVNTGI